MIPSILISCCEWLAQVAAFFQCCFHILLFAGCSCLFWSGKPCIPAGNLTKTNGFLNLEKDEIAWCSWCIASWLRASIFATTKSALSSGPKLRSRKAKVTPQAPWQDVFLRERSWTQGVGVRKAGKICGHADFFGSNLPHNVFPGRNNGLY